MINVKLLVLFVFIGNICDCYCDYCKICSSHTLCLYQKPGPGPSCKSYDKTAAITRDDVKTIVNKINQRRNFVALGLARNLPSAANMNQMCWSEELAIIAQRWADQCDPAVRPEKKDICRDIVDTKVGQNIATVTGLSPGLSVKSFVEVWFMQALMYTGSVTYYNQSQESKTNDFTQLIWANTTHVGCGKTRFSIDDKGTMVDRFVCNFAPKGNIYGKPVYTIGYPATQCKDDSGKDEIFTGLCKSVAEKPQKSTMAPTESSLLRILNLPNKPAKQDIDPIPGDYRNREISRDEMDLMRHQNLRHIPNKTHGKEFIFRSVHQWQAGQTGLVHHVLPVKQPNIPALPPLRQDFILRQHTIGQQNIHETMYKTRSPIEQYGDNNYVRETIGSYYDEPYVGRRTFNILCTRSPRTTHHKDACNIACNIEDDQCTRGKKGNGDILANQPHCKTTEKKEQTINACNSQKITCLLNPVTTPYNCNINCHCFNVNKPTTENRRRIPGEYVYYDYVPDLALRDNRDGEKIEASSPKERSSNSIHITTNQPHVDDYYNGEYFNYEIKNFRLSDKESQRRNGYRKHFQARNYPFRFVYSRKRSKRQIENQFSKTSFWIADEFDKRAQKRTPKYTTLRNKARKKIRTTAKPIWSNTEPITITTKDLKKHQHTDKSLSFEELMYFRKNRGGEVDLEQPKHILRNDAKKPAVANSTNNTSPLVTLIGNFSPVSACTRRLTCTWTRATITDVNGNEIDDGAGGGGGAEGGGGGGGAFDDGRTPWGHVENCTRKYTCSRLHYDRNVQASDTTEAGETTIPDEDYCERRALDVKQKDLDGSRTIQPKENHETFTKVPLPLTMKYKDTGGNTDCFCNAQEARKKRSLSCKQEKQTEKCISEKIMNYLALGKIFQRRENNSNRHTNNRSGCHCNASVPTIIICLITIYLYFYLKTLN